MSNVSPPRLVEVSNLLAENPKAQVTCPFCNSSTLVVSDEYVWKKTQIERRFECRNCGKGGSILLANETSGAEAAVDVDDGDCSIQDVVIRAVRSIKKN